MRALLSSPRSCSCCAAGAGARRPRAAATPRRWPQAKREAAAATRRFAAARPRGAPRDQRRRPRPRRSEALAARIEAAEADLTAAERRIAHDRRAAGGAARPARRAAGAGRPAHRRAADDDPPPGRARAGPARLGARRRPRPLAARRDPARDPAPHRRAARRGRAQRRRCAASPRPRAPGLLASRAALRERRVALARFETAQRARSQQLAGLALTESDRALVFGEEARDARARRSAPATIRRALAASLARAARPAARARRRVAGRAPAERLPYSLPVEGRLVTGVGEISDGGVHARGLTFETAAEARVVAPAGGRIVYAAPFRRYGNVVIIDHGRGWSSVITDLAALDVAPGQTVAPRRAARPGRRRQPAGHGRAAPQRPPGPGRAADRRLSRIGARG